MDTIKAWAKSMDNDDIRFILSIVVTLLLWWLFVGRKRYGTKGMR